MDGSIPLGVTRISRAVTALEPDQNRLVLEDGRLVHYEHLIVCPGIVCDWGAVAGLEETLGRNGVCSNYHFELAPYTWQCIQEFSRGHAVSTAAPMPFKCPGAPQKILYLAADYFQQKGREAELHYYCATPVIFGAPPLPAHWSGSPTALVRSAMTSTRSSQ